MSGGQGAMPLARLRVLDLTWWIAGPHATTQLAMMGADVIRLESARRADGMRLTTPYAQGRPGINRSGRWISHNYSKRSVALDLGSPHGRALAQRLVAVSDIVVENLSTGVLDRMGLGYDTLRTIKPDIILCSVSALGRDGPRRDYVGFGPSVAAYAGLAALTGRPDGPPGTVEPFLPDYVAAWHVALAVLAAVYERDRTGAGRQIEVSMAEATLSQLPEAFIEATLNGRPPRARGNLHPTMAPHGYYPCRGEDRWLAITVATDAQWQALCAAIGRPELAGDPRFHDGLVRHRHRDELDALLSSWTCSQDAGTLQERLQAAGVTGRRGACARRRSTPTAWESAARSFSRTTLRPPTRWRGSPASVGRRRGPRPRPARRRHRARPVGAARPERRRHRGPDRGKDPRVTRDRE
ncbi:MAG: CoA transferase [Dehalococcoidia bacterium]